MSRPFVDWSNVVSGRRIRAWCRILDWNRAEFYPVVYTCATHLLDRVLAVLRTDQPYELRDVDGTPVSVAEARAIILEPVGCVKCV